jgi:hypothetical protein
VEGGEDLLADGVDRADGVDPGQDPAALVVVDQRAGLCREHLQAVADRLLAVVGAMLLAGPAGQAGQQLLLLDLEVQRQVERDPPGRRPPVGGLGLGQGARVAVQHVPALLVGLDDPLPGHLDHDLVGHQVAPVHVLLGHLA